MLQILGLLAHTDWAQLEPQSPEAWHLLAEASRLAFADRAQFIGDPAFVEVPVEGLLQQAYLARRAGLIQAGRAMPQVRSGRPVGAQYAEASSWPAGRGTTGTSHFSVVDREGNTVSMTSSLEVPFGSRIMVNGLLLNSQLTDFDFRPTRDGRPVANAVAPGKRPRSSMAPTLVFHSLRDRAIPLDAGEALDSLADLAGSGTLDELLAWAVRR